MSRAATRGPAAAASRSRYEVSALSRSASRPSTIAASVRVAIQRLDGRSAPGCQRPERHANRGSPPPPGRFLMALDVALVTGASSGIGAAVARRIARDGRHLVLVARRTDRLEALAHELEQGHNVRVHVIARDLIQPGAARDLVREVEDQGLAIDWLVNNAGFGTVGGFAGLPVARELEEIRLNVEVLVELT